MEMPHRTHTWGKGITFHDAYDEAFTSKVLTLVVEVDHEGMVDVLE